MKPAARPTPLRPGILGCANIARAFARDVAQSPRTQPVTVASRDKGQAAQVSLDIAATLQALADSARLGRSVKVPRGLTQCREP